MILISNAVMKTISLSQLLSSCMDAAYQGCEIIQGFQNGGDAVQGTLKESDNIRSVVTQADVDAQARIIGGLRKTWGDDLLIIGEEDEADAPPHYDGEGLRRDILDEQCSLEKDEKIPLDELTIFVDPLDGTREFVELRLEHVACLIGISRNNRPVAGVIGVPFPDGTPGSTVEIHYAVSDQPEVAGVWPKSDRTETISATEFEGLTILTGDSSDPVLVNATKCAKAIVENHRHVIVGGTAAKLRLVAAGIPDSVAILHFKTELWDTCSAEALLLSKGGKVTDLFGSPLVHSPARPFGNVFGVVASSGGSDKAAKVHEELCRRMRADGEAVHKIFGKWMGDSIPTTPQAIDIARDLEGLPFSLEYIQDLLKDENPKDLPLVSYSIPESDAWRGMMSNGVRLCLDWKGNGSDHLPVSDIFYKRIVMADLAHARDKLKTAPHKLVRDVKSYQIEIGFLTSKACQCLIKEAGLKLNKVLGSDLRPSPADLGPEYQLESRFSIFLEYFQNSDGWKHQWLLGEEATKATLEELAKMHAYFWEGSQFWKKDGGKIGKELESIVWPNGGYMQPHLQGKEQLEKVHNGWKARYPSFEEDLSELTELEGADLKSLGKRLEAIAPSVGDMAHPFAESSNAGKAFSRYRTLIHGDPKQANFFFRRNPKSKKLEVGLIDFQWSGFGLAATDVAHHLTAAVMPDCLSLDGKKEKTLLDHYHSCLVRYLVKFGSASSEVEVEETIFPRAVLQEQYETAFLDVCRLVFAYAWRRWKPESTPAPESLNRNAYNKSLPNVLWLITRCHVLLEKAKQPAKIPVVSHHLTSTLVSRTRFLSIATMCLPASVLVEEVGAFPLILLGENIESMCQNGALMEERAIPGAYSSACMNLSERIVPLPKLTERNKKDGTIVITQQAGGSGQTGKTLWNSGLLLSRLLDELVEKLLVLPESRSFWSNQSIIELGCGTALGSITAHKLGAKKVLATDGNLEVVNLAKMNIDLNVPSGNDSVESIEARPLQWGLLDAMDYCESASLVLGADLTYNAGSWRVLAETMATVLTLDGNVLYISLGHEGFNVNAEMDGFLSVAKAVGLIQTPDLNGVDVSQLLQNSLTNAEKKILEQSGGARVIILKRRPTLSKAETQKSEQ